MKNIHRALLCSACFLILLIIPLAVTVYTPILYDRLSPAYESETENLRAFFIHQETLSEDVWSSRDILHMRDVRALYDKVILALCVALIIVVVMWRRALMIQALRFTIFAPLIFVLLIPFFSLFWKNLFHPLLFTNDLWLMTPDDLSYHIFPLSFFLTAFMFIIISASALSAGFYTLLRKYHPQTIPTK